MSALPPSPPTGTVPRLQGPWGGNVEVQTPAVLNASLALVLVPRCHQAFLSQHPQCPPGSLIWLSAPGLTPVRPHACSGWPTFCLQTPSDLLQVPLWHSHQLSCWANDSRTWIDSETIELLKKNGKCSPTGTGKVLGKMPNAQAGKDKIGGTTN